MALTRIRAQQISNIDYKQAVRVVTTTNITLSGGAPISVDGVALSVNSRILVNGQSTATQNGLYLVQTLGTGSNGTWVRTNDTNSAGEMQSGMVVTVTEGNTYRDTLWTLTTDDPIVLGASNITFQQSTSFNFGNISANGTAILANTVGDAISFVAGDNISITGNATAKTVTFGVTGIQSTSISNGTSNVSIDAANANITMSVDGTANVIVVSTDLVDVAGNITASGNVTGNYFFGNGSQLSGIITSVSNINNGTSNVSIDSANANVTVGVNGTANIAVFSSAGVEITGNLTTTGNIVGGGVRSTTSSTPPSTPSVGDVWYNTNNNILYRYTYDDVNYFWEDITGGSIVANSTAIINGNSTAVVSQNGGNIAITVGGISNTAVFAQDRVTFAGNLLPSANVTYSLGSSSQRWKDLWISNSTIYLGDSVLSASGNVLTVGGESVITSTNANTIDLSGNITGGNINTGGNIIGAYIIGNGSQLTGLAASYGNANVAAYLPTYSGLVGGTLSTAAQPNVTSVGVLSGLTVTGPMNFTGNLEITGNINATGNLNYENVSDLVVGDPLIYIGEDNTGNLFDLGIVVTWNDGVYQHGGWARDASDGTWKLFGNVIPEPTTTVDFTNAIYQPMLAGTVTAVGNISGNYILGNGSQLTGISTSTTKIFNGTSQINIGVANGAANVSIGTASNVAVFDTTGVTVDGAVAADSISATNGLLLNSDTVTANYTVSTGFNAVSVGPMTVANNISVTVTAGQRWVIL
jgi:hypothetical protein